MNPPLVSVIVGVYNKAPHVVACLQSVLEQTWPHLELLVVDDGSTDGSDERIQSLSDPRLRFFRRSENSGRPAVARNWAMSRARGDYWAFLDADDLWMPAKLEKQMALFAAHPQIGLVHTRCRVVDDNGRELHLRHAGRPLPTQDALPALLEHCWVSISSVVVRRTVAAAVGAFDERPDLRGREDYDWLLRAAVCTRFGVVDEPLTAYRQTPASLSHGLANWRAMPRDYLSHRDTWFHRARWGGRIPNRLLKQIAREAADENAGYWRARHDYRKAAWFARQMLYWAPLSGRAWRHLLACLLHK